MSPFEVSKMTDMTRVPLFKREVLKKSQMLLERWHQSFQINQKNSLEFTYRDEYM